MVIPVEESLIYVRPLYLRAQGGRIPELTRVIVAYEDRIVMEETLDAAIARLFGTTPPEPPAPDGESVRATEPGEPAPGAEETAGDPAMQSLAAEARAHYDRAVAAQKAGDWAKYGEELRLLGEVLNRMRQR
jgi:uncharacterized membrane protein (UPF0182 family)